MDKEIERLEIKIAYLEKQIADLNDVVIKQMKALDETTSNITWLEEQVRALIEESGSGERPNRKPPHY